MWNASEVLLWFAALAFVFYLCVKFVWAFFRWITFMPVKTIENYISFFWKILKKITSTKKLISFLL